MDCGRARTAWAAAEPAQAPAQRADSGAKWAASHSSMQPESCRFNRGLANIRTAGRVRPTLRFITECGETVDSISIYASADYTLQDHGCVRATETERIRQCNIDFALARRSRHQVNRRFHRRVVEIDGRRSDVIANRQNAKD